MSMLSRCIDALLGTRKVRRLADENSAARQRLIRTLESNDVLGSLVHTERNRKQREIAAETQRTGKLQ